jgi:translocation and assembly module TamB
MARRAKLLRALGLAALLLCAALAGAGAWLLGTQQGLAWALARASEITAGRLVVEEPHGTLGGGLSVKRLRYTDGATRAELRDVDLRVSLLSVLLLRPEIARLECRELVLSLPQGGGVPSLPQSLALPTRVYLDRLRVGTLRVTRGADRYTLRDLQLAYRFSRGRHRVDRLHLELDGVTLDGQAELRATRPFAASGRTRLSGTRAGVPFRADFELSGSLEALSLQGRGDAKGAVFEARATLRPLAGLPPETLSIRAHDVDLKAFDPALPRTRLSVSTTLERRDEGLEGRISAANALVGRPGAGRLPIASLQATLRTDLQRIELADLVAQLGPAGSVSGRMALDPELSFDASLLLARIDLSQLGDFPASALSGEAKLAGSLAGERRVRLDFTLAPSQLAARALTGGGRVLLADTRVADSSLSLEYSGASIGIDGTFGRPEDRLRLRVDAPDLSTLAAGALTGRATLRGELSGGWQRPAATLKADGAGLRLGAQFSAAKMGLDAQLAADPSQPLHVSVSAAGVTAHGMGADRLSVKIDGTRLGHTISMAAHGEKLDFSARLEGALRGTGEWHGKLLAAGNRGALPFELEEPAAIDIAPRRAELHSLVARFEQGRVRVSELRWVNGRLASTGTLQNLAVVPLLRLAGWATPLEGKLALGAEWSLTAAPRLNGSFRLWREDGDLLIGGSPPVALGLRTLEVTGRVVEGKLDAKAGFAATAGNGDVALKLEPQPGAEGLPYAADSRLEGRVAAQLASLAPFAILIDRSAHIDGKLKATLEITGTLGRPLLAGDIEGDAIRYARPPDGIELVDGRLRARLEGDALRISQLTISSAAGGSFSAQGTLARGETERATITWKADKLALLNRPDQRLVVSGEGAAVMDQRRLSFSGALRADSGFFSFEAVSLPQPGDDVVVVGRETAVRKDLRIGRKENPSPVDVDLDLDLGRDLRIRGHGLDTGLSGKVHVRTDEAGVLIGKGTVRTVRGTVTAYGTQLQIERGRLIFDGPVNKPLLDVQAMRRNQEVAAGVAVTGTLQNPTVRIVSEPPVPEGEALSWLVLGRAPSSASGGDIGMLQAAASALLGGESSGPTKSLPQALGIDAISLGGSGAPGAQFVTVAKRVNDRITVLYEQGLGVTASVLRLDFELSSHWSLSAATGQQSDVGLRFNYSFR